MNFTENLGKWEETVADIQVVQQVRQGQTTEYYAAAGQIASISDDDLLVMSFDAEVNIDEIIVINGGTLFWDLKINYPQTDQDNYIYSSTDANYSMNGGEEGAGNAPDVKTWFRLPANSRVLLHFSSVTTSGPVELLVIAR